MMTLPDHTLCGTSSIGLCLFWRKNLFANSLSVSCPFQQPLRSRPRSFCKHQRMRIAIFQHFDVTAVSPSYRCKNQGLGGSFACSALYWYMDTLRTLVFDRSKNGALSSLEFGILSLQSPAIRVGYAMIASWCNDCHIAQDDLNDIYKKLSTMLFLWCEEHTFLAVRRPILKWICFQQLHNAFCPLKWYFPTFW